MSLDTPYDRIEVIFPTGTDPAASNDFLSLIRSIPFRKFVQVRPNYIANGVMDTEEQIALKLTQDYVRSIMVIKYPNRLIGKSTDSLTSVFRTWTNAIWKTVPADFDLVHVLPDVAFSTESELIACTVYVLSQPGAIKVLDAWNTDPIIAYELSIE